MVVSLITIVFIAGGRDDDHRDRKEILAFDGEDWKEVGQLQKARFRHAATKIYITDIKEFCK